MHLSAMQLPADFTALMRQQWGEEISSSLCESLSSTEPSVSVRLNRAKLAAGNSDFAFQSSAERVPWCPDAYWLTSRPAFTFDPLLHAGAYYVQDASSMFLAQVVRQHVSSPSVVLDLCAAPGGKSTLLRALLPDGSLLVSNEPIAKRAQILAENITKWGHPDTAVTQNYPADFASLTSFFDFIVADVPCSGEGMFRKEEEAVRDWSMDAVRACQQRQRDILRDVWPALKPGGLLCYSTCTFNHLEDEDNVEWICRQLGAEVVPLRVDATWNVLGCHHFLPSRLRGEGFFLCLLRKISASSGVTPSAVRRSKGVAEKVPTAVCDWVQGDYVFSACKGIVTAFPVRHAALLPSLRRLHLLTEGVRLAEPKGRDWQPSHALALSLARRSDAFPVAELDYDTSLAYLRREAICVDAPRGYVLVAFRGLPLGFVNNLGNRANNLYPPEWRIRSGYTTAFTLAN